ncbi:MAG: hypothetical protein GY910_24120 [bacterium]|nr:hypothetical protein [Deltaproteobacteria bacterium]MCP4908070.1 hypothetical protein [bacterium]
MTRVRIVICLFLLLASTACNSLNYPMPPSRSEQATAQSHEAPDAPVLLGIDFGVPENDIMTTGEEPAQEWYDLTRRARADRQRGDLEGMRDSLARAATLLSARPATNAQRRAVFGMRARLAMDFVSIGESEKADTLADQLFEDVEREPELGGPAMVELAYLFSRRRGAAAEEAGLPESQLPLLRIALLSSESASASRTRLDLAFEISGVATREGDHDLARRAIDRAVLDAQTVAPSDKDQLGSLKIFKARISLAQRDLGTAEASATSANRLFEEIEATSAMRAVAEATLARVLGEIGDFDRARAIGMGAQARLGGDPPVAGHPSRVVFAELGRLERAAGDLAAARSRFESALEIPGLDFDADIELVAALTRELAALDPTPDETAIEIDAGKTGEVDP